MRPQLRSAPSSDASSSLAPLRSDTGQAGPAEPCGAEIAALSGGAARLLSPVRLLQGGRIDATETGAAQVRSPEARPVQARTRQIGLAQIGAVEPGKSEVAATQAHRARRRRALLVRHEVGVGHIEIAGKKPEQDPIAAIAGATGRDRGEHGHGGGAHQDSQAEGRAAGIVEPQAQDGAEEARLGAHQEHAGEEQQHDIGQHYGALHRRDRRMMEGQERNLHVEQEQQRQDEQGEPRNAVENPADHAAALRPRHALDEEGAVELQPKRVRAPVRALQKTQGGIELQHLARQQHVLGDHHEMHEREDGGRDDEEADEINPHLQERQHDPGIQEQVAVGQRPHRESRIGHEAQEQQPGRIAAGGRRVDRVEQTVRIDRRLGIERRTGAVVHAFVPDLSALSPNPLCAQSKHAKGVRPLATTVVWKLQRWPGVRPSGSDTVAATPDRATVSDPEQSV